MDIVQVERYWTIKLKSKFYGKKSVKREVKTFYIQIYRNTGTGIRSGVRRVMNGL